MTLVHINYLHNSACNVNKHGTLVPTYAEAALHQACCVESTTCNITQAKLPSIIGKLGNQTQT